MATRAAAATRAVITPAGRASSSHRPLPCVALLLLLAGAAATAVKQPKHILFLIADDLGFNDISLHSTPTQIPTPNIDALFTEGAGGVHLANYHVQSVCSPSRSSFLSGRHVIHTGIFMPFSQGTNDHLRTDVSLLPQYLQRCCNYSSHLVGKYHLGQNTMATLPTSRGFESHRGYLSGAEDYVTHETTGAFDFSDNLRPAVEYNGSFSTRVFTNRAIDIISDFGVGGTRAGESMFLYLAYQNVHWPLEAPPEYFAKFEGKTNGNAERQWVCAMASFLDDGIGNVTKALKAHGLWNDTLIVFTADNGGPTNGNEGTESNNFPLRGGKNTLYEGGTRVNGIVRGAGIATTGYSSVAKIHATDWLPTLVRAASGRNWTDFILPTEPAYLLGDGLDVWDALSTGAESARNWVLLETHPRNATDRVHGDALIVGDMKILRWQNAPAQEHGWWPAPGQPPASTRYFFECGPAPTFNVSQRCSIASGWCLFNVSRDPCEHDDLAAAFPDVVATMVERLGAFMDTAVAPETGQGCDPIKAPLDGTATLAWQPCDAPCVSDAMCNHGSCKSGACACDAGWSGFRCNATAFASVGR